MPPSGSRQSLEAWITEALSAKLSIDPETGRSIVGEEEGSGCSVISLVHMIGAAPKEVMSRKIKPSDTPRSLADLFEHRARSYCQDLPGVQTFNLFTFYGKEPGPSHPFIVNVEVSQDGGLFTEGPTATGMAQQAMRHTELMTQVFVRQSSEIFNAMKDTIESFRRENHDLRKENYDAILIVKDLVLQRDAADDARKLQMLQYQRSTEERKKLLAMAPALANALTGREMFPQSTADTAIVEAIAEALANAPEDKLFSIMSDLNVSPEAMGLIMKRASQVLEKKQAEKRAAAMVPAGLSPEADAGGG
jgi:hypothetical protein